LTKKKFKIKIDWLKQNAILSKKLNVFGSLLLIISFIVQTYFYNKWNDQILTFEQANRNYTEMTRTSLEYQNLYLGLNSYKEKEVKETLQHLFVQAAAEKYRLGRIMSTNVELIKDSIEAKKFIDSTNALLLSIDKINDMRSLYVFVNDTENKIPSKIEENKDWLIHMNNKKETASYIFIGLQLIGSIMIALGFRYQ